MSLAKDIVIQKVGAAANLLAQAKDATSAKRVADMAHAAEVYARRQQLSEDAISYAHEVKIDAQALLGEFLIKEKEAGRMAKGSRGTMRGRDASGTYTRSAPEKQTKLSDRGISFRDSVQSQKLAKLRKEKPKEFEAVKRGEKTYKDVHREGRKQKAHAAVKAEEKLKGKYRVIYADPPWKYGDGGYGSGPAEFHYPTMTVEEICELPVQELALSNAVLFIWVTSPLLEDVFRVIAAWGFKYKASFVWDKVKHNVGHYVSVRHEFLLIATRGSCTPDDKRLIDSVQEIERGKHSEKPEAFRVYIDQMYPNGKRVELFARKKTDGWDVWGNQI